MAIPPAKTGVRSISLRPKSLQFLQGILTVTGIGQELEALTKIDDRANSYHPCLWYAYPRDQRQLKRFSVNLIDVEHPRKRNGAAIDLHPSLLLKRLSQIRSD
jgi:hypothetical protein